MIPLIWIAQAFVALVFIVTGTEKVMRPKGKSTGEAAWRANMSTTKIRAIGVLEVLGGIGLIVPAALGIATFLTSLAALGLALLMLGAIALRVQRNERGYLPIPVVFLLLALGVAIGRFTS